jgi:hypothetical protein
LRQGIFDQKTWDEKEEQKKKPNPAFRIRWGPGDVLIHRPTIQTKAPEGVAISLTKLHLSAVENVSPSSKKTALMTGCRRKQGTEAT